MSKALWFAIVISNLSGCNTSGQNAPPEDVADRFLKPAQVITLPNVEGRFDHFAADVKGNRLFVAALGNDTLEVINTDAAKVSGRITGLHKPQGVAFIPDSGRIAVASGEDGTLRFYDAATLKPGPTTNGLDDADNVRYDGIAKVLYVGYGGGALAVIEPAHARKVADVKLEGHPESFQLEREGKRIFVNVPEAGHVAVIDREKRTLFAKWGTGEAKANFPMALDEAKHRLFIGCRKPAKLVVLDTESAGKVVAEIDVVGDADDLFYDAVNKRIYVSGGAGAVTVVEQSDPDTYHAVAQVKTAPGARTSFFIPEAQTLYVAVPHRDSQQSELRRFKIQPAAK